MKPGEGNLPTKPKSNNQIFHTMEQVIKQVKGNKFIYTFKGKVVRTSTKEFKFACIAKAKESDAICRDFWGFEKVISLGNNRESTLNSMKIRYGINWTLSVVEIQ